MQLCTPGRTQQIVTQLPGPEPTLSAFSGGNCPLPLKSATASIAGLIKQAFSKSDCVLTFEHINMTNVCLCLPFMQEEKTYPFKL